MLKEGRHQLAAASTLSVALLNSAPPCQEFSRSAYLHCLYNYSYLAVVVALCLILGLHHHRRRLFGSKGLSKASSLAWKSRATALRLRFKKRAILGRWDLRGNVGMVSLFAAWTLYNAVAAFVGAVTC